MCCFVRCILASVLLRVPPLKFPSLPSSQAPSLAPLPRSFAPSLLHLLPLSLAPSMPTFLPHSFTSSTLHPLPLPPTLPHIIASSLPPLLPPAPTLPLLPPPILPSLPAAVQFNVHRMCVWQAALYCVAPSHV